MSCRAPRGRGRRWRWRGCARGPRCRERGRRGRRRCGNRRGVWCGVARRRPAVVRRRRVRRARAVVSAEGLRVAVEVVPPVVELRAPVLLAALCEVCSAPSNVRLLLAPERVHKQIVANGEQCLARPGRSEEITAHADGSVRSRPALFDRLTLLLVLEAAAHVHHVAAVHHLLDAAAATRIMAGHQHSDGQRALRRRCTPGSPTAHDGAEHEQKWQTHCAHGGNDCVITFIAL